MSYNEVANFPGWPTGHQSAAMYNWVQNNTSQDRIYAQRVPYSELKVGDLIFYDTDDNGTFGNITHVAFYDGGGYVFDANAEGVPVGRHPDWENKRVGSYAYRILGAVEWAA